MRQVKTIYGAVGGRKAAFGLLAAALLTSMAFPLDASFGEYSLSLLGALGLTQGFVAYEDTQKHKGEQ